MHLATPKKAIQKKKTEYFLPYSVYQTSVNTKVYHIAIKHHPLWLFLMDYADTFIRDLSNFSDRHSINHYETI